MKVKIGTDDKINMTLSRTDHYSPLNMQVFFDTVGGRDDTNFLDTDLLISQNPKIIAVLSHKM